MMPNLLQQVCDASSQVNKLGPRLRVRQTQHLVLLINVVPLQGLNLSQPTACEEQQLDAVDGR